MNIERENELLNYELAMAGSVLTIVGLRTYGHLGGIIRDYFSESAKRIEAGRAELHGNPTADQRHATDQTGLPHVD